MGNDGCATFFPIWQKREDSWSRVGWTGSMAGSKDESSDPFRETNARGIGPGHHLGKEKGQLALRR
jgi:hypothetical protein